MKVGFKKLHPNAKLPKFAHLGDSGMDLYACVDENTEGAHQDDKGKWYITINMFGRRLIPTGLAVELPPNYEGQVRSKSGLALKNGVVVLNSPGTIDNNYTGFLGVILLNTSCFAFHVYDGMKIAQMVIKPVEPVHIEEIDELDETERGDGGFGSTGDF